MARFVGMAGHPHRLSQAASTSRESEVVMNPRAI
jgi:hypothetical protein